jgi:hypothetical protein
LLLLLRRLLCTGSRANLLNEHLDLLLCRQPDTFLPPQQQLKAAATTAAAAAAAAACCNN